MNSPVFQGALKSRLSKHFDHDYSDEDTSIRKQIPGSNRIQPRSSKNDPRSQALQARLKRIKAEQNKISESNKSNY